MTRTWAPSVTAIQAALAQAIQAEHDAVATNLPSYLQGANFAAIAGIGHDDLLALPHTIRVLPFENTNVGAFVTNQFEGSLGFPCLLRTMGLAYADLLLALQELQGLLLDAVANDITLGGLTSGLGREGIRFGPLDIQGPEAKQEVTVFLVVRN